MTSMIVLDVVIGLVFVYLLYSLLATIIQELIATYMGLRSKNLKKAITRMLNDDDDNESTTSLSFYSHPLVKYLSKDKKSDPSYISKSIFSKVIVDLLRGNNLKLGDDIRPLIQNSIDEGKFAGDDKTIGKETMEYIRSIWIDAKGDIDAFEKSLETWFDYTMERCAGWYKKQTQWILLGIGLALAIGLNIDSIAIASKLQKDPKLREAVVQQADEFAKAYPNWRDSIAATKNNTSIFARGMELTLRADSFVKTDITKTNGLLGLGWDEQTVKDKGVLDWFKMLLGWIISALAISMGAPFWFDLLNKLMKLRSSISIPTKEKNEPKDQQPILR